MIMEPLVSLSVTATTLTRHLAYLRQAMATLHVVYASISILLDMGGAGLIRDIKVKGAPISKHKQGVKI